MSTEVVNEFSFLPEQAALVGVSAPQPMRRVTVPVGESRRISALAYTDDAPRITLLHGAGLNAHTWDTTVLSMGEPALAIDLPGHGDSTWRDDAQYSPTHLADDVILALEQLTDTPQVLVGHSLGGLTAASVAARRPDLVSHIVYVDIVPGLNPRVGPAELRRFYATVEFPDRDAAVDHAMSFGMGGDRAATARGVFHNTRVREDGLVEWKHHFARLALQVLPTDEVEGSLVQNEDSWGNFTRVTAPTTLVYGSHGYLDPEVIGELQTRVPGAEVIELEAGHNVQETQPVALGRIISSALSPRGNTP